MRGRSLALAVAGVFLGVLGTTGQTPRAGADRFVGTWRLVSTEEQRREGTAPISYLGPRGVGYLIYTDSQRMCAVVMNPMRPQWATSRYERDEPSATELRSAFNGFRAFCGTYEVDPRRQFVVHHPEMDLAPNAVDEPRKYIYAFSGGRLMLHPSPPPGVDILAQTLTWEKVP